MNGFFTALQFLTRINLVRQDEVTPQSFGASVRYFPLVGAVIGAILAGFYLIAAPYLPIHTLAALLIGIELILTGALHCDGLMDSADGLFSGRSRERILEIMKDSRVGANGVVAFVILILLKWSLLLDLLLAPPLAALFVMPVLGRFAMVVAITCFPYARPEGIGKAFAIFAGKKALHIVVLLTLICVAPWGGPAIIAMPAAAAFAMAAGRYVCDRLGGLTGDIYGAVTELTEILVLLIFVLAGQWNRIWWQ